MHKTLLWLPLLLLALILPGLASAEKPSAEKPSTEKPSDTQSLAGVSSGKIAWDINMANAKKLLLYLKVMDETYEDLKRQGVEPNMVLTFRGPSVRLITTEHGEVSLDEEVQREGIAEQLAAMLAKPNVRAEACSVATRLNNVDPETLLPNIEHVGNTFVSQIGYQAQGYATIPIM